VARALASSGVCLAKLAMLPAVAMRGNIQVTLLRACSSSAGADVRNGVGAKILCKRVGYGFGAMMTTRQQITRLAQRIEALDRSSGAPCLIVVDPSETRDQALARYMQQRGTQPRGQVTFVYTGVPRSRY